MVGKSDWQAVDSWKTNMSRGNPYVKIYKK
jgi:hypothetical protein